MLPSTANPADPLSGSEKHLFNSLTFVPPDVCDPSLNSSADASSLPSRLTMHMDATTDPMCPSFPDSHVTLDSDERQSHQVP